MFHNPLLRPVALGGSVPPKAFMITVQATHVRGMPALAHPLRQRGEMHPRAGAPAPPLAPPHPEKDGPFRGLGVACIGRFWCRRTDGIQPTDGTPLQDGETRSK
jgi:hypothetical protein